MSRCRPRTGGLSSISYLVELLLVPREDLLDEVSEVQLTRAARTPEQVVRLGESARSLISAPSRVHARRRRTPENAPLHAADQRGTQVARYADVHHLGPQLLELLRSTRDALRHPRVRRLAHPALLQYPNPHLARLARLGARGVRGQADLQERTARARGGEERGVVRDVRARGRARDLAVVDPVPACDRAEQECVGEDVG